MIADLRPYPEYKESAAPWLGRIPIHWKLLPNRALFCEVKECGYPHEEMLSVTIAGGIVRQKILLEGSSKKDSSKVNKSAYKLVNPNDIVYNKMRAWQGAIGASAFRGIVSPAYIVVRPRLDQYLSSYCHYLFRMRHFAKEAERLSYGITSDMWCLRSEHFKLIYSPMPSPSEQSAIVRFLGWASGRLERAIREKRRVIALLGEQKQAIVHRAVTRGLDPSVPLKPSGIPWLGDIPKHWEVTRIKSEFRCLNPQRVPLNAVERGAIKSRTYDYYGASGVIDKVESFLFDDELLLIAEDGANLVARNLPLAIIARGKFWVNNHAHILKPRRGSLVYLAHVLESLNYEPWISGAAQPKLTQDRLMSVSIAVAPPAEQFSIVSQVSQKVRPLEVTISRLEREIDLLREYRTRLVADVVTGKLDVREAAARLPEKDLTADEFASGDEMADDSADGLSDDEDVDA